MFPKQSTSHPFGSSLGDSASEGQDAKKCRKENGGSILLKQWTCGPGCFGKHTWGLQNGGLYFASCQPCSRKSGRGKQYLT